LRPSIFQQQQQQQRQQRSLAGTTASLFRCFAGVEVPRGLHSSACFLVGGRPAKSGWAQGEASGSGVEKIEIPRHLLVIKSARSSGPGGQNVNKVNTKVDMRIYVGRLDSGGGGGTGPGDDGGGADDLWWLPEDVGRRLRQANAGSINKKGELVVTSQQHRTQHLNLDECTQKLQAMVDAAAVPPKERVQYDGLAERTKKRYVEDKRRRSDVKKGRQKNKKDSW